MIARNRHAFASPDLGEIRGTARRLAVGRPFRRRRTGVRGAVRPRSRTALSGRAGHVGPAAGCRRRGAGGIHGHGSRQAEARGGSGFDRLLVRGVASRGGATGGPTCPRTGGAGMLRPKKRSLRWRRPRPSRFQSGSAAPSANCRRRKREVIALKIEGELTFAQIAEALDISINTAASRYRYALEKLRVVLATPDGWSEDT